MLLYVEKWVAHKSTKKYIYSFSFICLFKSVSEKRL